MIGVTIGVVGRSWRGIVTPWGSIVGDGGPLDWYVAADDRWHTPEREATVRQRRIAGTPVIETRMRIPGGDVVSLAYAVADHGGMTVVELENDSPSPIAVALTRRDLRTSRPPSDAPVVGIDLPGQTTLLPIGHRATVSVAIAHDGSGAGELPPPTDHERVVRGWQATCARASRLEVPDAALAETVTASRCELALAGPASPVVDPVGFIVGAAELVRMFGEPARWVADVATAVEDAADHRGWETDAALDAAALVLHRAGERRAAADIARIVGARPTSPLPAAPPSGPVIVAWAEQRFARRGDLLPAGLDARWQGHDFAVHDVPIRPATALSYALRWHGERVAVLWEQTGPPVTLTATAVDPLWRSTAAAGEALLEPGGDRRLGQ